MLLYCTRSPLGFTGPAFFLKVATEVVKSTLLGTPSFSETGDENSTQERKAENLLRDDHQFFFYIFLSIFHFEAFSSIINARNFCLVVFLFVVPVALNFCRLLILTVSKDFEPHMILFCQFGAPLGNSQLICKLDFFQDFVTQKFILVKTHSGSHGSH